MFIHLDLIDLIYTQLIAVTVFNEFILNINVKYLSVTLRVTLTDFLN